MLNFILGKSGSGKTTEIFSCISNHICNENDSKKIVILVPEQYTYETERRVLKEFGSRGFDRITVMSFSKLSEKIIDEFGEKKSKHADEMTKLLVISAAIKEVQDELRTYTNQINSIGFYEEVLSVIEEFEENLISPARLSQSLANISSLSISTSMQDKLNDIMTIYSAYEALLENKNISTISDISMAAEFLQNCNILNDTVIYIDEFKSFTADEIQMLTGMLNCAEDIYISLCTLPEFCGKNTIFQVPSETYTKLCEICSENQLEYKNYKLLKKSQRFEDNALAYLCENIFKNKISKYDSENDAVKIVEAPDIAKECKWAAAKIRELVIKDNFRYRDIAIIGRSIDEYAPDLESALKIYNVSYFLNLNDSVYKTALSLFIVNAFEAITFNSEKIFAFAKTGFASLSLEEVSRLENYCYVWDIKNRLWCSDFTARKYSDDERQNEKYKKELTELNNLRTRLIEPLINFKKSVSDSDGCGISKAVYKLILEFSVKETLKNKISDMISDGNEEDARNLKQTWDIIVETLEVMNRILGEKPMHPDEYLQIYKQLLMKSTFASPPQYIDTVVVGDASMIRLSDVKIVFVIGANEGKFPCDNLNCSVFSAYERKKMNELGISISYPDIAKFNEERFTAYKAISSPSQKLFITYSFTGVDYSEQYPSVIVRQASEMFDGALAVTSDFDSEFYCSTVDSLFEYCADKYYTDNSDAQTARLSAELIPQLSSKIKALTAAADKQEFIIKDKALMSKLNGEDVIISATRIEDYYSCKFYHFCKYGLNLKTLHSIQMDAMLAGSLMHYCLECMLKEHFNELQTMSKNQIISLIKEIINDYIDDNCGGIADKSNSYKNKLGRFAVRIVKIMEHLQKEFSQCDFTPDGFETEIGPKSEIVPQIIESENGKQIYIYGKVDRIDIYECDGQKYIRVIDYKSSEKKMLLGDILSGHNLQLMLYLFVLTSSENSKYNGCLPAGAFYSALSNVKISESTGQKGKTDENIEKMVMDTLALNGLILDDENAINAMDKGNEYHFVNITDEMLANLQQMEALKVYCERMIKGMVDEFDNGNIEAIPIENSKKYLKCQNCEYFSICGKEGNAEKVAYASAKKADFYQSINEEGEIDEA